MVLLLTVLLSEEYWSGVRRPDSTRPFQLAMENGCGHQLMDLRAAEAILFKAIEGGSTNLVRFLLEKGSLFPRSGRHRDPEATKLLLIHGADTCTDEPPGINVLPLSTAATLEHYAVTKLLRESINLEAIISSGGQNQEWLLLIAAARGWDDMVRQILDQGCSLDVRATTLRTFHSSNTSNLEGEGLPAISLAAGRGHYSTVQLLLSYNARWHPHWKYEEPNPLLHAVASGHLHIVKLLINDGAGPNGIGRWYCPRNEIANLPYIYWAVTYPEAFRFLLDRGADLSLPVVKAKIQIDRRPITAIITSIRHMVEDRTPIVTAPTSTHVVQKALQGAEPLGGASFTQTSLALASKQRHYHFLLLLLRFIGRKIIAQDELLLKLGELFLRKSIPEVKPKSQLSAYYAKRSGNLHRR